MRVGWLTEGAEDVVRKSRLETLGLADEALRRYETSFAGLSAMISDIRTVCPLLTLARKIPQTPFYVVTQVMKYSHEVYYKYNVFILLCFFMFIHTVTDNINFIVHNILVNAGVSYSR